MLAFETIKSAVFPANWCNRNIISPHSIGRVQTVKPYKLSRSNLKLYLLLYTLSGNGKLKYQGKEYELEKGDLFLIDCEKEHEYSAVSETWDFCYVHINYHPHLQEYYNGICESGENVAFHYPQFYKDCFLKLESFSYEMNAKIEIKASAIVLSTILDLMTISEKDIPQNIKSCANYIAENFTEDISVEFLASIAGLSKYYFIRNFYKYYDSTPYEYLTFCRINHSKNLLISTNASIEQIAGDCGFSSVVTFNRCFKNKEGCSPSNFRKRLKMG